MNFRPELAAKVMAGEKTVTRRQMSGNPRSPWYYVGCSLVVGGSYAVCPGRGRNAIGRVTIIDVRKAVLGDVDRHEAQLEGFASRAAFEEAWRAINGSWSPYEVVWRIEFELEPAA